MGQYNYKDLKGSFQKRQDEEEAKNGRLPEGIYKFALGMAVKEAEQKSKATVWVFKCKILKPGTIYHQVERQLRFSTADHFYARESMGKLIEFLDALGIKWSWIKDLADMNPSDSDGEIAMLSALSFVADQRLRLDVAVEDQEDKDGNVSKYQQFTIQTQDIQPINWAPFLADNELTGASEAAVGGENMGEDPADEVEPPVQAPPPAATKPAAARNPFAKKPQ